MTRVQRADLLGGPAEVVGRQQPQRDELDVQLVAPAEELLDLVGAGEVAALDLLAEGLGPPPVAVAHDADVLRDLVRWRVCAAADARRGRRRATGPKPLACTSRPCRARVRGRVVGEITSQTKVTPGRLSGCAPLPWIMMATQATRAAARGSPRDQAAAARLAAPRGVPAQPGGRHRAGRLVPDDARPGSRPAIFARRASLLFGVSALYHRGHWRPRWHGVLRRLDHSNIFLLIAGTYTPFALTLLRRRATRRSC